MKKRTLKRVTVVGAIVGLCALNSVYGVANVALWKGLRPKRVPNTATPSDEGLFYEEICFQSYDGLNLKGWYIPSGKSEKTIIFSHGYGQNRSTSGFSALALAKFLHKHGYNVLLFDFRNSGESEGKMGSIAQKEQHDVLSAVRFAKNERDAKRIILMGWSMGASASLLAGSKSDEVDAVIADSPFAQLDRYLVDSFTHWTKMPKFMAKVIYTFSTANPFGFKARKVRPIEAVKEAKQKPIFLIHAKDDPTISYQESVKIKDVYPLAEFWNPDEGGHIQSYQLSPTEYEKRILRFIKNI